MTVLSLTARNLAETLVALTCTAVQAASPAPDTGARIVNADRELGNWLSYGRDYQEQHYSPLDQINAKTVGNLGLAWWCGIDEIEPVESMPLRRRCDVRDLGLEQGVRARCQDR
jgi:glucose dehydrogenase